MKVQCTANRFLPFMKLSQTLLHTLFKRRSFIEPPKKASEMSKSVHGRRKFLKKDKNIYKIFKCSFRVSAGRTFSCKTFFLSSVQQNKVS